MSYNNHAHLKLCSTQRGSVVQTRHPANVQHRLLTHEGYQGPGSYDVEKPPAVQASERAGRPMAAFVSKQPRLPPEIVATSSSCEQPSLHRDSDYWAKSNQRRNGGNYMMSSLGR